MSDKIEAAARAAHEVNRVYCREVMNDNSHLQWKDAPDWARESCLAGVRAIAENPDTSPETSHEGWLEMKRAEGWVYGPIKDAERKTHPCMVAYRELPLQQRVKDTLFGVVVRAVLNTDPEDVKTDPGIRRGGQLGQ